MPNCDTCDDTKHDPVSYFAYESMVASMERTIFKLWIVILVLIVSLVSAIVWFEWRESQYVDVVTTIEAEQESEYGDNYAVGGDFTYDEAEGQNYG